MIKEQADQGGTTSRWWYLDLAAEFPQLEIYTGRGWRGTDETLQVELGERVMTEQAFQLPIYTSLRDRIFSAAICMLRGVQERAREKHPEALEFDAIPAGWVPDIERWDSDREYMAA